MSEYQMGDIIQTFTLNQQECNQCGACVKNCEFNAITIHKNQIYFNPCRCRRCDGCENLCPKGAMQIRMHTTNIKPYHEKKVQERWWETNTSCHITCDGICNDCQR